MLVIYKQLFEELNKNGVDYCIYKGLNHLTEDLYGERGVSGDIDVLVSKESRDKFNKIIISKNIYKGVRKNQKDAYIGVDVDTKKIIFIDVDHTIKLGNSPEKPYYMDVMFDKLKINVENNIKLLDVEEYIPLMFIVRVTALNPKEENLVELHRLLSIPDQTQEGYIKNVLQKLLKKEWNSIKNDILRAESWNTLQKKYKFSILESTKVNYKLLYQQKFKKFLYLNERIKSKIFKVPLFKIRKKGYLVAFIGVDGAGKSSTIDYIQNLDYFKYTGIKRIYFGNNEYWIPRVVWGLNNAKNKWVKIFFAILAQADRACRSLFALYYVHKGYIVIADRFYYDDFIGRELIKKNIRPTKSIFKKIYRNIFKPRIWIKPNLTLFLDVSPDVAYTRKQDYPYETMLEVNLAYKKYMPTVEHVVIVDADRNQKDIYHEVVSHILELDKK